MTIFDELATGDFCARSGPPQIGVVLVIQWVDLNFLGSIQGKPTVSCLTRNHSDNKCGFRGKPVTSLLTLFWKLSSCFLSSSWHISEHFAFLFSCNYFNTKAKILKPRKWHLNLKFNIHYFAYLEHHLYKFYWYNNLWYLIIAVGYRWVISRNP